jgi:hypothetical protein
MARWLVLVLGALLALASAGCSGGSKCTCAGVQVDCSDPSCTAKDPPQVFLTAPETNQIGTSMKLRANVVGCTKVSQIQILNGTTATKFLIAVDNPTKFPVDIDLPPSTFNTLYQSLGIAVKLTLLAKGICDDGRTNKSTPVGVSFFPVASVTPPAEGNNLALPDVFVAEGGVPGIPTTFVGCVGTASGTGLARFDTTGTAVSANLTLPFACTYNSVITDKNKASGFRWLLEQGVGAFSFDSSNSQTPLNIKAYKKGTYVQIGIGPDGDAIVWDSKALPMAGNLFKLCAGRLASDGSIIDPTHCGAERTPLWASAADGIMAGTPVVSQGEVFVIMWSGSLGAGSGNMLVQKWKYDTGAAIATNVLTSIEYGDLDVPMIPPSTFSADGQLVYFAFQNTGGSRSTSGVVACATNAPAGCGPTGGAKWISPLVDEVIVAAVPFSNGALIAAIGQHNTYFLSSVDGHVVNIYDQPIKPDGDLVTRSVQPGSGTDFYLLNGPAAYGYPTEIVAIDNPTSGELWRVQITGGDVPAAAVNLAIDEGNNTWLRIGANQVQPLTLGQYRTVKGANLEH